MALYDNYGQECYCKYVEAITKGDMVEAMYWLEEALVYGNEDAKEQVDDLIKYGG